MNSDDFVVGEIKFDPKSYTTSVVGIDGSLSEVASNTVITNDTTTTKLILEQDSILEIDGKEFRAEEVRRLFELAERFFKDHYAEEFI